MGTRAHWSSSAALCTALCAGVLPGGGVGSRAPSARRVSTQHCGRRARMDPHPLGGFGFEQRSSSGTNHSLLENPAAAPWTQTWDLGPGGRLAAVCRREVRRHLS